MIHRSSLPALKALAIQLALAGIASSGSAIAATGCESIAGVPITWNIDYSSDIQNIFNTRCANCHVDHGGSPSGDLDQDPEFSYDDLVNAPSGFQTGRFLVIPGQPLDSVLFEKVNCDAPNYGVRMPNGRPPLPLAEQAMIFDWIMLGAPAQQTDFVFANGFEPRP